MAETDTSFKKKYGPQPGRARDRHSGLTPILPLISGAVVAPSSGSILRREERQRSFFHGFTAKELLDLDANITTSRILKPSDLKIPIHPCFQRKNWLKSGTKDDPRSLGKLGSGKWAGDNDRVWEILQPTLQLATLLLDNIDKDFYDSLLHGPQKPIDPARFPDNPADGVTQEELHKLRSFTSRRLPPQDPALQKSKFDLLEGLVSFARFKFKDKSDTMNYNGRCLHGFLKDANGNRFPRSIISLDPKNYEPLLRPNITPSERLGYQWRTAITLTHECSHVCCRLSDYFRAKRNNDLDNWYNGKLREPYFENHSIQECGFLMEQYRLGGVTRGECNPKGSLFPTIAFFWTEWPSSNWVNYRTNLILKTPPLHPEFNYYPIPVVHFEDVHQTHFWNHIIKAFGIDMLGLRSLRVRMRYSTLGIPSKRMDVATAQPDGSDWKSKHAALKLKQDMSADERRACKAGDVLIERAKLSENVFFSGVSQDAELRSILEFNAALKGKLQAAAIATYAAATAPGNQGDQSMGLDLAAAIEQSMQDQYDLVLTAAKAHCQAVDSYCALANSGKAPLEIQRNLIFFNQGFKGFARELAYTTWTDDLIEDYQYIDEILEFRRQMLYSPNDRNSNKFPIEYREFEELDSILQAYNTPGTEPEKLRSDIYRMTEIFETRWGSSRYARICGKIMRLATDIGTGRTSSPDDAVEEIDAKIQALISLRNGENGNPSENWRKTLEDMIQKMENIVGVIRKTLVVPDIPDTLMTDYDAKNEDDIPTDQELLDLQLRGQPA